MLLPLGNGVQGLKCHINKGQPYLAILEYLFSDFISTLFPSWLLWIYKVIIPQTVVQVVLMLTAMHYDEW